MIAPLPSDRALPEHGASTGRLMDAAQATSEDSLKLLERLVVASRDGPAEINSVLLGAMEDVGCASSTFSYDPRTVPLVDEFASEALATADQEICVIGRRDGADNGRSLLLFAHPDVEDYRTEPAWAADPFVPQRDRGRICGWGVADDLAGLAIMVRCLAVLQACGLSPGGDVTMISAPSKKHRRGIAAALHDGIDAEAAVYLHPAESGRGLDEIKAFAPGQLEFTVTVDGRLPETSEPAHTAFAHTAVNPFAKSLVVIEALHQLDAERGKMHAHPRLQHAIGRSANLMLSQCVFDAGTLSRIAPECRIGGAMTLLPGETLETVMAQVEQSIRRAAKEDSWLAAHPPEVIWLSGVTAGETSDDSPIYRVVASNLARVGADPKVNPLHTSSDIRNPIVQKNIPTVGFGPVCGGLTMSGEADEWVEIDSFVRAIAATASVVMDWGATTPEQ